MQSSEHAALPVGGADLINQAKLERYKLSESERRIAEMILREPELTITAMSTRLHVAPKTIKFHVANILRKSNTHSRAAFRERSLNGEGNMVLTAKGRFTIKAKKVL